MIRATLLILTLLASPFALAQEQASVVLPEPPAAMTSDEPSFFSPKTEGDVAALAQLQVEDYQRDVNLER